MRKMSTSDWAATTAVLVAALAALGTSGTAYAAAASPLATTSVGAHLQAPPPPPHRFHARFHTLAQCQAAARHDHPTRPGDWDCRRGPDRNNPFEYWGI